jgi:hypothetical protein
MIQTKWPSWHPETELTANHLCGLEDYLLSRTQILDEGAFGIERISDWRQSIQAEWTGTTVTISVGNLRGVTPGGQPVWLRDDEPPLTQKIGDEQDPRIFTPGQATDVWIIVNSTAERSDKLTLDVVAAVSGAVPEWKALDSLYLGRYELPYPGGQKLQLVRHPIARRLCAFGPLVDPGWKEWVKPLRERLNSLLAENTAPGDRSAASSALSAELLRLSYEWPFLPIPTLARRLRMIGWLLAYEDNRGSVADIAAAVDPIPSEGLTGEDLPRVLAHLLPQGQNRVNSFAQSLQHLLELLVQFPVNFHAPIGLLRQWHFEIAAARSHGLSDPEQAAVSSQIESALGRDDWSKAVALVTALNLNSSGSKRDVTSDAVKVLDQLYSANAAKGPTAGPMVFYWLAKGAELQPHFPRGCGSELSDYFTHLRGTAPRADMPLDRLRRYLDRASLTNALNPPVKPYFWWKNPVKRPYRDLSSELRLVVAGSRGSGKSTFIRWLVASGETPSIAALPESEVTETIGRLASGGNIGVRVVEIDIVSDSFQQGEPGPALDPFRDALSKTDLLILAIQPSETDRWNSDALKELALWTLARRPGTVVVVAYTKADEYGVVEPAALRFVEGKTPSEQLWALQTARYPEREFGSFAAGRQETKGEDTKKGGVIFMGRKTVAGDSTATRQHILEGTQPLWLALLGKGDALLNGYFISADPNDAYLKPRECRGVAQLVADFLECLKGGAP